MEEQSEDFLIMGGFEVHFMGDEAAETERSSLGQAWLRHIRGVFSEAGMGIF